MVGGGGRVQRPYYLVCVLLPKDNKKYPQEIKDIYQGDLVMFPSSLFHHTLPFESQEERISFAFDVIPEF